MALDILHDNWGPYTHTEVENALKAYLAVLENRINQAIQSGGVGLTDLSAEVQALLNKANTALQPENISAWAKAQNKPGYTADEITYSNLLTLADKLADMDQKIQAAAQSGVTVDPQLADSGNPVANRAVKAAIDTLSNTLNTLIGSGNVQGAIDTFNEVVAFLNGISSSDTLAATLAQLTTTLQGKQATLVSGTNIKTINSNSILGSGNLVIEGTKGDKGDKGDTVVLDPSQLEAFEIINDLVTGGASNALSAEMGKRLNDKLQIRIGSFNDAWVYAVSRNERFCWLLNDTIDNATIRKPIFHIWNGVFIDVVGAVVNIVSVAPAIPSFSIESGTAVSKNTPLVVTFDAGSILHYTIDGGSEQTAAVSPASISITAACSIEAWAENAAGTSAHRTASYSLTAPADPVFSEAAGAVLYGTILNISFNAGLTLHYKVGDAAWATTDNTPLALLLESAVTIQAYTSDGSQTSNTVSRSYTIAAPAAPTIDLANGSYDYGTNVAIAFTEGVLHYTINSGTEQTESTSPKNISIDQAMTIEAWTEQGGVASTHVSRTYALNAPAMKITASEDTSVDITPTGGSATTYQLSAGENRLNLSTIDPNDDGIESIAFADNTKITAFDGGGATFTGTSMKFFAAASNLVSFTNLVTTGNLTLIVIGGCSKLEVFDTSRFAVSTLNALNDSTLGGCFSALSKLNTLDLSMFATKPSGSWRAGLEKSSAIRTLKIGKWDAPNQITNFLYQCNITTIVCSSETPPSVNTTSWLDPAQSNSLQGRCAAFQEGGSGVIKVPASAVNAYKTAAGWSNLADFIVANDE